MTGPRYEHSGQAGSRARSSSSNTTLSHGDLKGYWSLTVTGNWRLIFEYDAASNAASSLDLIDYHGK